MKKFLIVFDLYNIDLHESQWISKYRTAIGLPSEFGPLLANELDFLGSPNPDSTMESKYIYSPLFIFFLLM